jgi:hypothetical protein
MIGRTPAATPWRARAATAFWRVLLPRPLGPDSRLGFLWWLQRHRWERARAARPSGLQKFEERRYSQNGEDGIIAEVLRRLGISVGFAIEIGAGDGTENCTRALVEDGWHAVWIDAAPLTAGLAGRSCGERVNAVTAVATAENTSAILDDAGAPLDPALLAIDIDGNDFHVLAAVLAVRRPHVIVAEYNALAGPSWWVQPYEPTRSWNETTWHGAGLRALTWLARRHGFELVGCDSTGVDAFFVRQERAGEFDPADARHHYTPPAVRLPFGHPWRPRDAMPPLQPDVLSISVPRRRNGRRGRVHLPVVVRNFGDVEAHGYCKQRPVSLAYRWVGSDEEPRRRRESFAVPARGRTLVILRIDMPDDAPTRDLELFLVQEDVRWFGDRPRTPLATVRLRRGKA